MPPKRRAWQCCTAGHGAPPFEEGVPPQDAPSTETAPLVEGQTDTCTEGRTDTHPEGATESLWSKIDEQAGQIQQLTDELALARDAPASPGVTPATRATLESQAQQIVELQRQIAEQSDAEKFLDARAATLQSKIDGHEAAIAQKQQEIDDLFAEIHDRDAKVFELEQAQANLGAVPQQTLAAPDGNDAAAAELTRLKTTALRKMEEKTLALRDAEERCTALAREKADAQAAAQAAAEALRTKDVDLASVQQANSKLQEKLAKAVAMLAQEKQQLRDLEVSRSAHAAEVTTLQAQLAAAAEEKEIDMAMLAQEKADAEARIKVLNDELAAKGGGVSQGLYDKAVSDLAAAKTEHTASQELYDRAVSDLAAAKAEHAAAAEEKDLEISMLEQEVKDLNGRLSPADGCSDAPAEGGQAQLAALREEKAAAEEALEAEMEKLAQLEEEKNGLEQALEEEIADKSKLEAQLQQLEQGSQKTEATCELLRAENSDLQAQLAAAMDFLEGQS